jgi:hypothetical protein
MKAGLKVGPFLAGAKISRVDVAVDGVGVFVPDLLATVPQPGKQALYKANDGTLETYAIHCKHKAESSGKLSQTAQLKPLGALLLKIYDKRSEQLAKGVKPPFGDAPVTRIEVSKRRFGNKPCSIKNLANLKNPLTGAKVGLVTSAHPSGGWQWLTYVEAVRACGPDRAAFVCGLSGLTRKHFEERFAKHPSDVLNPKEVWSHWNAALAATGLNYMIEAAEQLSAGVPLPFELLT